MRLSRAPDQSRRAAVAPNSPRPRARGPNPTKVLACCHTDMGVDMPSTPPTVRSSRSSYKPTKRACLLRLQPIVTESWLQRTSTLIARRGLPDTSYRPAHRLYQSSTGNMIIVLSRGGTGTACEVDLCLLWIMAPSESKTSVIWPGRDNLPTVLDIVTKVGESQLHQARTHPEPSGAQRSLQGQSCEQQVSILW